MPIDSRDKRASAIGVALAFRVILPAPDPGAENQADRQQVDYAYRGILVTSGFIFPVVRGPMRFIQTSGAGFNVTSVMQTQFKGNNTRVNWEGT